MEMGEPNALMMTMESSAFIATVVSVLIAVGFTTLLLALRGSQALRAWTLSMWLTAIAATLTNFIELGTDIPGRSLIWVTVFALLGSVFLLKGMAIHVGRELSVWRPVLVMGACLGLIGLPASLTPAWLSAVLLYAVATVVLNVWVAWMLLRRTPHELRLSYRFAAAVFGLYVILGALSAVVAVLRAGDPPAPAASPVTRHVAEFGFDISLAILHCFAVMLLIVQKMFVDLRERATRDGMTGLLNRASVVAQGEQALATSVAQGRPFSLLIIDLDHFKQINDRWGHLSGDSVLRCFADVLRAAAPMPPHLLGRYGGEEFVVMVPGADGPTAQALAQRIVESARGASVETSKGRVPFTVSVGVCAAREGNTLEQLLGQADAALYLAKAAGRDRVCLSANVIDPQNPDEARLMAAP